MNRRKLLMGNWKMYKTVAEARAFAEELGRQSHRLPKPVDYAVCAPFTALHILPVMLPTNVAVGAQNVYFETEGAFTGEIAPGMLSELHVRYVLVGHSERRLIFGESDEWAAKKVKAVTDAGMVPVLCVGENLSERESGQTETLVRGQVRKGLSLLDSKALGEPVIAYEPVWAIGSGKTPTAEEAQAVIQAIRAELADLAGADTAARVRILYGGSVKPANIASFVGQPDIDGALVGGASLEAESFVQMAEALAQVAAGGEARG